VNVRDIGVPAAQKAVVLTKEDASSLDLLGWLLLLDARYAESEQTLFRTLELEPQNASAHLHLGMLYLEQGDRSSAYSHFVNARDMGNTDAQAILNQYFP
jgi:Flp pilus assembly protein TadD